MKNPSYTKKGPGRRHNHETRAWAAKRIARENAARGSMVLGAASGMVRPIEFPIELESH